MAQQTETVVTGEAPPRARWIAPTAEVLVCLLAAGLFPLVSLNIKVNPLERTGQVSGLASLEFRFTLVAIALVAALVLAARLRRGIAFDITSRLVCAAISGLATGLVAGGIVVALRGTSFGLNGAIGDTRNLALSADAIRAGVVIPTVYPPGPLHVLAWYADLFDLKTLYAIKHLQIIGTAVLGPAVYLSWRLMLRPAWALGIGLVASLPLIDSAAYKPYSTIVLMVFIPIVIRFLQVLRRAGEQPMMRIAQYGVAFGAAFGLLCLLYSGWFKWSAPGLLVAGLLLFPWRAWRKGLVLVGLVGVMFALIAGAYIHGVLTETSKLDDAFVYFDALTEPTYIAMFGGELPASQVWPPLGELGGVGLFTIVLAIGLGCAVALGRSRTVVITVCSTMAGAWLLRFWYAHLMWKTKLVQLYPRTTAEILYCLLILCGYAAYLAVERVKRNAAADSPLRSPSGLIGAVCGLLLLFGSAGSLISNRYMPNDSTPMSFGILAWNAHLAQKAEHGP
jgi:hypothetical protein